MPPYPASIHLGIEIHVTLDDWRENKDQTRHAPPRMGSYRSGAQCGVLFTAECPFWFFSWRAWLARNPGTYEGSAGHTRIAPHGPRGSGRIVSLGPRRTGQNRWPPRVQSATRVGRSSLAYSLSLFAIRAQPLGRASRRGASPLGLRVRQMRARGCARIATRDRLQARLDRPTRVSDCTLGGRRF